MKKQFTLAVPLDIIQFCWKEMTRVALFADKFNLVSKWPGSVYIDEAVKLANEPITFAEAFETAPTLQLRHTIGV